MKIRTRSVKKLTENNNYWTSFTDIMTTTSLVFFFIMLIVISIVYIKYIEIKNMYDYIDNIAQERKLFYEEVEEILKPKLQDNISFSSGKLEIKTEFCFDVNDYKLTPSGKELATLISDAFYQLFEEEEYRDKIESIEVRGHTDNTQTGEYNRYLSTNRASAFINAMIPSNSKYEKYAHYFKSSGMSKYNPKVGSIEVQNSDEKSQNRRIEIYINVKDDDIANAIIKLIDRNKK